MTIPRAVRVVIAQSPGIARHGTRRLLEDEPGFSVVGETNTLAEAIALVTRVGADVLVLATPPPQGPDGELNPILTDLLRNVHVVAFQFDGDTHLFDRLPSATLLAPTATAEELVGAVGAIAHGRTGADEAGRGDDEPSVVEEYPTRRELEVLLLLEQGLSNSEMANRLQRSTRGIQFHVSNLLSKLGAHSRTELIHLARKRGWLT